LSRQNIETSIHFIPLHLHPYYRDKFGYKPADFPNASSAFERIVSLPIYPRMTEADVESVIGAVRKIVKQTRR
jgi:dTDP-4-amino-4,6-dideoxygalactose transaminase